MFQKVTDFSYQKLTMTQSQALFVTYIEALQANKDVTIYENTISDMIYKKYHKNENRVYYSVFHSRFFEQLKT